MTLAQEQLDLLIDEANVVFAVSVMAIAKHMHRTTGQREGTFPCPRCHTGTVAWSVATNGHASVLCSTTWQADDGETYRCTSAVE